MSDDDDNDDEDDDEDDDDDGGEDDDDDGGDDDDDDGGDDGDCYFGLKGRRSRSPGQRPSIGGFFIFLIAPSGAKAFAHAGCVLHPLFLPRALPWAR